MPYINEDMVPFDGHSTCTVKSLSKFVTVQYTV